MFEKTVTLCNNKQKHDMIKANMAFFGVPPRCPVTKNSIFCYDGNKPVLKFSETSQKLFKMFIQSNTKEASIKINITHNTGNSCFEVEHSMIKKKN
jgi:hypothetical protein